MSLLERTKFIIKGGNTRAIDRAVDMIENTFPKIATAAMTHIIEAKKIGTMAHLVNTLQRSFSSFSDMGELTTKYIPLYKK